MKKNLLIFIYCLIIGTVFSQNQVDSLLLVLENVNSDQERAQVYYELTGQFTDSDDSKALEYVNLGLEQTKGCRCPKEEYQLLIEKGIILQTLYEFEEAEKIYEILINKKDYFTDVIELATVYRQWGAVYWGTGEYEKAVSIFEKGIVIAKEENNSKDLGGLYCNVGVLYHSQGDYENAKKYYYLGIEQLKINKEERFLANIYQNLSKIIGDKGGDLNEGLALLDSAILIFEKQGLKNDAASVIGAKADLYNYWEKYEEAIPYSKLAIEKLEKGSPLEGMFYGGLFNSFLKTEQYDSCFFYGEKALEILQENNGSLRIISDFHKNLVRAYTQINDGENARKHFELALELSDSLYNQNNQSVTAEFNSKFETAEKEKEIAEQKLQIEEANNSRNQILIGTSILLLIAGLLFQRYYYHQKRKKQATENALLEEQKEGEKLRELNRLKSTFFTNISHELRTPLTLVAAPLNDALETVKPSPLKNTLELAHSNTQKLLRLVNEILDLSKLEAGKVEAKLSEVQLIPLIRRLFYSFESIAQVRGLQLVFNSNISKDLKVRLDEKKFEKIINNLLSNAVKFTEKGGNITLNAIQENRQFQFEVVDTGMGISQEDLPKVFDRFYQSTSEHAPLQGGTGIGLSLAKELAHLMNGDLKVESELEKGSRFILNLPLEYSEDKQGANKKERQEVIVLDKPENEAFNYTPFLINGHKPRILIIEDNLEMSDYLEQNLRQHFDCVKAYDGLEALNLLKKNDFDIITSDVMMPNMDGFAFRSKLLEDKKLSQIPFVMLTARAMEEDKLKGLRLGVDDYLTKPFSLNELKARLQNLLQNKVARDTFQKESDSVEDKPLSQEEQLLQKAEAYVLAQLDNAQLRVDDLAKELNLSSRQLSRTLNKYIGISPVNFILEIRLQKARQMLENRQFMTVSEVRYEIGIESASYFTKKFRERFGKNPKSYLS